MNTIEQAQEVAERLRSFMGSWPLPQEAAGTIDALIAELSDERMRCAQADNAVAQMAEELAALKGQEPSGWTYRKYSGEIDVVSEHFTSDKDEAFGNDRFSEPVYLAAGAQPVQQEPLFWYRPCSDGGYEGPISNGSIEDVRKRSGAWIPLVAAPVQAGAQERKPLTDEEIKEATGSSDVYWSNLKLFIIAIFRAAEATHGIK